MSRRPQLLRVPQGTGGSSWGVGGGKLPLFATVHSVCRPRRGGQGVRSKARFQLAPGGGPAPGTLDRMRASVVVGDLWAATSRCRPKGLPSESWQCATYPTPRTGGSDRTTWPTLVTSVFGLEPTEWTPVVIRVPRSSACCQVGLALVRPQVRRPFPHDDLPSKRPTDRTQGSAQDRQRRTRSGSLVAQPLPVRDAGHALAAAAIRHSALRNWGWRSAPRYPARRTGWAERGSRSLEAGAGSDIHRKDQA
jgi:hypothetical protein